MVHFQINHTRMDTQPPPRFEIKIKYLLILQPSSWFKYKTILSRFSLFLLTIIAEQFINHISIITIKSVYSCYKYYICLYRKYYNKPNNKTISIKTSIYIHRYIVLQFIELNAYVLDITRDLFCNSNWWWWLGLIW